MVDFKISIQQKIIFNDYEYNLDQGLMLLKALQDNDSLRLAAQVCGFSYRKAWNLLKELEIRLGGSLVKMQRGRGSQLTKLGSGLLQLAVQNEQEFEPQLYEASGKAKQSLYRILPRQEANSLRVAASDSDILNRLRDRIPHLPLSLNIVGSEQALTEYWEGKCDLAGFHLATGLTGCVQGEKLYRNFNLNDDRFILLEQRQQGLVSRFDNPVTSLQQIIDEQLLFVNRQRGSGTRNLVDSLLFEQGINYENIRGYYHEEHTHLAVATMVATRQADVAMAVAFVAERMQLNFTPLALENYYIVFKKASSELYGHKAILGSIFEGRSAEILNLKQLIDRVRTEFNPL